MPVIALRGKVLFPKTFLNFDVGRAISRTAINKSSEYGSEIFIASQKNLFTENPTEKDICTVGVVARVKQIIKLPNNNMKVGVEALYRAKVVEFKNTKGFFSAVVCRADYVECNDPTLIEAYMRVAKTVFMAFALNDKRIAKEMLSMLGNEGVKIEEAKDTRY